MAGFTGVMAGFSSVMAGFPSLLLRAAKAGESGANSAAPARGGEWE